jgi:hypothetical protein
VIVGGAASVAVAIIWAWRFPELRRIDRFDDLTPDAASVAAVRMRTAPAPDGSRRP